MKGKGHTVLRIYVQFFAGTTVTEAIKHAMRLSNDNDGAVIYFKFNDVELTVRSGDDIDTLLRLWNTAIGSDWMDR